MGATIAIQKAASSVHSFIHSFNRSVPQCGTHSFMPHNEIVGCVFFGSFPFYLSIVSWRRFMFMNVNAFFKSFLLALCGIDLLPRWTLS